MEETFDVTRVVQELDPSFRYCHVLGHKLSAKETAKDPSKWKDIVTRAPSGVCSNGAIHGAFQERFRVESLPDASVQELVPELLDVCEPRGNWRPTGLEQASCVHALGHLAMYVTSADIEKSLALCDAVTPHPPGHDFTQLCYDGAFMQIYQPLEPDDFALIEGKEQTKKTAPAFCASFAGIAQSSCVSESAALFRTEILADATLLPKHCAVLPANLRPRCEAALVYYFIAQLDLDIERSFDYCSVLSGDTRSRCFANAAGRFIEVDWRNSASAIELCSLASDEVARAACFNELVKMSDYNFPRGSKEAKELCEKLPSPYREGCYAKQ